MDKEQKYIVSEHAEQRLAQRGLPWPGELNLRPATAKMMKRIRETCPATGTRTECEYLCTRIGGRLAVYVCKRTKKGALILLTAFLYEKKNKHDIHRYRRRQKHLNRSRRN